MCSCNGVTLHVYFVVHNLGYFEILASKAFMHTQVEQLSEEIQSLQQHLRSCLQERTKLESKKNTLENLLSSNLLRRKEQLQQELEEISLEDNRQQLEMKTAELEHLLVTLEQSRARSEGGLLGRVSHA